MSPHCPDCGDDCWTCGDPEWGMDILVTTGDAPQPLSQEPAELLIVIEEKND